MTDVTFYTHVANRRQFACRLAQKVFRERKPLLILLDHQNQMTELSEDLWTLIANSFLAHQIWHSGSPIPSDCPIILTQKFSEEESQQLPEIVLNLSTTPCEQPHFSRILEIIDATPEALESARQRFKHYRAIGFTLTHHNMQANK